MNEHFNPDYGVFIGPCAHGHDPYDRCDECALLPPLEAKVYALEAELQEVKKRLSDADKERVEITSERDEARKWLEGICSEFEGAVAHADWRAAGSKGMSVPFTGDFASVVQLPGAINKMRWWVKVFRAVLNGEQP